MKKASADKKTELTKHFFEVATPCMIEVFEDLYKKNNNNLQNFQHKLKEIRSWNAEQIDDLVNGMKDSCDYLEKLVNNIFWYTLYDLVDPDSLASFKKMKFKVP